MGEGGVVSGLTRSVLHPKTDSQEARETERNEAPHRSSKTVSGRAFVMPDVREEGVDTWCRGLIRNEG